MKCRRRGYCFGAGVCAIFVYVVLYLHNPYRSLNTPKKLSQVPFPTRQAVRGQGDTASKVPRLQENCTEVPEHRANGTETPATGTLKVEIFPAWTTKDPQDATMIRRLYLYSAIIDIHKAPPSGTHVHFVTFQDGQRPLRLTCCAKLASSNHTYSEKSASVEYSLRPLNSSFPVNNLNTIGVTYRCWFPFSNQQLQGAHVTLMPQAACPRELSQYLRVHQPERRAGGLAICAKTAYGFRLDPSKLVEWFETQRLLGVDRVQLFDLGNTERVYRLLRYYQDMKLLEFLPYKLPGRPWGRSLLARGADYARFGDDETVPIRDCRLRLAGYDYVMDVDMDEVIVPRNYTKLKPFLKRAFAARPKAASLNFKVQFFVDNWGPVDPQAPLLFLRYLNSTSPRVEVTKHVYLPARTYQGETHYIRPYTGYTRAWVSPAEATVFHYRSCKRLWKFCDVARRTDKSMQRFRNELVPAVQAARQTVGLDL